MNEVISYERQIGALTVQDVRAQVNLIQQIMAEVMKKDEHFGIIPGAKKPSLLKAGAEKLCLTFRLDPQYESVERYEGAHFFVKSKCVLWHIPSGQRFGSGEGSCSSKESKYAWRESKRKCPECGAEAIVKGKDFKNDGKPTGWLCFAKKGGCGAKFLDGDEQIEGQQIGRVANEDLADQYNTVLKMANKRSLVAAVLNATAASDIFSQDLEDIPIAAPQVPDTARSGERPMTSSPAAAAPDEDFTAQMDAAEAREREAQSKKLLDSYSLRFDDAKDSKALKAIGREITPEIKAKMIEQHRAMLRENYLHRETQLAPSAAKII